MTAPEAIEKLKALHGERDVEMAGSTADQILCDLLTSLGYKDVVDAYDQVPRRYA